MKKSKIDTALNALLKLTPPGTTLTRHSIASFCRCDKELIRHYERRALRKIRSRLRQGMSHDDFATLLARADAAPRLVG